MKYFEEKSYLVNLRKTREEDLDFVLCSEREPDNAQYVGQWTNEQHRNALFQDDILHLIVEEKTI